VRRRPTEPCYEWHELHGHKREKKSRYLEETRKRHILQSTHPMKHVLDLSKIRHIMTLLVPSTGQDLSNKFTFLSKFYIKN
jgi:hypothetical protein